MTERNAAAEPVDDGGIRLKLHSLFQPVDEDRRDTRSLGGNSGLFLHYRSEFQCLLWRHERKPVLSLRPLLHKKGFLRLVHAVENFGARRSPFEQIRLGKKTAF